MLQDLNTVLVSRGLPPSRSFGRHPVKTLYSKCVNRRKELISNRKCLIPNPLSNSGLVSRVPVSRVPVSRVPVSRVPRTIKPRGD